MAPELVLGAADADLAFLAVLVFAAGFDFLAPAVDLRGVFFEVLGFLVADFLDVDLIRLSFPIWIPFEILR